MALLDSFLERKAQVLEQRQADFQANPEAAVVSISASSKVAGITGARPTRMGEHLVLTDSAPGLAGHALGPSAPELLLGALASCLVHTYLIQATLMNVALDQIEVTVQGKLDLTGVVGLESHELPMIQDITYSANVETSAPADVVEQMHAAVEQTCPVLNTLRYPVSIGRSTNTPQPK